MELLRYRTWPCPNAKLRDLAISDVWPLQRSPLRVVKHQPSPEPLSSHRPADAWLVSSARPQYSTGGMTVRRCDSQSMQCHAHLSASPQKTPHHSPKALPAQQRNAYLQSGLLAPYAISTQDTAKQALKGNQNCEFLTDSLTCSKLHMLLPPQHLVKQAQYHFCKWEGSWQFGKKNPGKYPNIADKPCARAEAATFPPSTDAALPGPKFPTGFPAQSFASPHLKVTKDSSNLCPETQLWSQHSQPLPAPLWYGHRDFPWFSHSAYRPVWFLVRFSALKFSNAGVHCAQQVTNPYMP